eukprot:CAMPEP_0202870430 /NCGR_PEP_ID=MMETSP1391-20130828/15771_1 /ASSEMBLY_ACC=CAM_ASM_000867 /TAXON_ID=1034604 /ORGANISM="Chlamydomonas leiostraca, Strain SAG 11-49" /LENGTH=80 /DNA_ID=CAMNT_0049551007 /DNA_START=1 /DNA_END=239 /DNA_ORIENTATION=+
MLQHLPGCIRHNPAVWRQAPPSSHLTSRHVCRVAAKDAPSAKKKAKKDVDENAASAFLQLGVDPVFTAGLAQLSITAPSP